MRRFSNANCTKLSLHPFFSTVQAYCRVAGCAASAIKLCIAITGLCPSVVLRQRIKMRTIALFYLLCVWLYAIGQAWTTHMETNCWYITLPVDRCISRVLQEYNLLRYSSELLYNSTHFHNYGSYFPFHWICNLMRLYSTIIALFPWRSAFYFSCTLSSTPGSASTKIINYRLLSPKLALWSMHIKYMQPYPWTPPPKF